jgi:hypothetical protein
MTCAGKIASYLIDDCQTRIKRNNRQMARNNRQMARNNRQMARNEQNIKFLKEQIGYFEQERWGGVGGLG